MKLSISWSDLFREKAREINFSQNRSGMNGRYARPSERWREGDKVLFTPDVAIESDSTLGFGDILCTIGSFSSIVSPLRAGSTVGRYVSIAPGGTLARFRHPIEAVSINSAIFNFGRENVAPYFERYERANQPVNKVAVPTPQPQQAPVSIGNDVWIGGNVTLSGGVRIGDGAIIAGGSVVTRDVEPYSVVAGVPAIHRKWRFPEPIRSELLDSQWWDLELGDMYALKLDFSEPEKFLSRLHDIRARLRPYSPKIWHPIRTLAYSLYPTAEIDDLVITGHSTFLGIDPGSGRLAGAEASGKLTPLRASGLELRAGDQSITGISDDGIAQFGDASHTPQVVSRGSSFHLKVGDQFVSVTPSGKVMFVSKPLAWEQFTSAAMALGPVE